MDKGIRTAAFITLLLTVAVFAAMILACIFIPRVAAYVMKGDGLTTGIAPLLTAAYVGVAAAMWFLVRLLFIMLSVYHGDPFIRSNVRSLKQIAACCVVAACCILFVLFFYGWYARFGLYICTFILLLGALSASVLSGVFNRAVEYKAENDLTV